MLVLGVQMIRSGAKKAHKIQGDWLLSPCPLLPFFCTLFHFTPLPSTRTPRTGYRPGWTISAKPLYFVIQCDKLVSFFFFHLKPSVAWCLIYWEDWSISSKGFWPIGKLCAQSLTFSAVSALLFEKSWVVIVIFPIIPHHIRSMTMKTLQQLSWFNIPQSTCGVTTTS